MQKYAPIVLFVYNRPHHTRRTLNHLQKNLSADKSHLFIFSDAARSAADMDKVNEVRQLINEIAGFKSVTIICRETHLGLAGSIINGVTQIVNQYDRIIVFEDDLLSSPFTLQYFNDALDLYEKEEKVMHIGAYMYNLTANNLPEAFFYRAATSWGWATWARAWKYFEPDIKVLEAQFDPEKINRFSIEHTMNFWKQVQEFKAGKNNSWAIRWYASVFLAGGLTLNPSKSFINNIGNDGTGVHSNIEKMYDVKIAETPVSRFPPVVMENEQAYMAIRRFLKHRKGNLIQRGIRYLIKLKMKYIITK